MNRLSNNTTHEVDSTYYLHLFNQLNLPSRQQEIYIASRSKTITVIRDDLIHPVISGNKWRKLKYHLIEFQQSSFKGISSMGGVYSNHLHALAYLCNLLNIPCSLLIYGLHESKETFTLLDCKSWNASLIPISRLQASALRSNPEELVSYLAKEYYWIPEGGGGEAGERGMQDLMEELPFGFDTVDTLIVIASGTGTSVSGILKATKHCRVASLKIVKMAHYAWEQDDRIIVFQNEYSSQKFAKKTKRLDTFIQNFKSEFQINLDPVYTSRLMEALLEYPALNTFQKIFFIHTGGLQANRFS
jgi:1-aminocyclopropane-1-carboxylate deaminase